MTLRDSLSTSQIRRCAGGFAGGWNWRGNSMKGTMAASIRSSRILLIENDPAAADKIRAALAAAGSGSFDLEWVRNLCEGLQLLSKKGIDAVLLELSLPDSCGIETFDKLFLAAPEVPIL